MWTSRSALSPFVISGSPRRSSDVCLLFASHKATFENFGNYRDHYKHRRLRKNQHYECRYQRRSLLLIQPNLHNPDRFFHLPGLRHESWNSSTPGASDPSCDRWCINRRNYLHDFVWLRSNNLHLWSGKSELQLDLGCILQRACHWWIRLRCHRRNWHWKRRDLWVRVGSRTYCVWLDKRSNWFAKD